MKYLIKKWFMEKKKIMALLLVFIEVMVIVCIFGILFKVDHMTKQMEKMNDNEKTEMYKIIDMIYQMMK